MMNGAKTELKHCRNYIIGDCVKNTLITEITTINAETKTTNVHNKFAYLATYLMWNRLEIRNLVEKAVLANCK